MRGWQLMCSELDEILREQNRQDKLCLQHYITELLWPSYLISDRSARRLSAVSENRRRTDGCLEHGTRLVSGFERWTAARQARDSDMGSENAGKYYVLFLG